MLEIYLKNSRERRREEGFSLTEIMFGIVIIGILTAIVVPMFLNAKAESDSATVKADLQSAAILIEQEAIDNNGLYPTYFPNELKNKPSMKKFVYSYSDTRTNFCIQAPSPVGKLFISSKVKSVTSSPCTEPNIAEGGNTPWENPPTIQTPAAPNVVNTWASDSKSSVSVIKISPTTCVFGAADQGEWASQTSVQYQVTITNTTRGGTQQIIPWSDSGTITVNLAEGGLPEDNMKYEVQARCLIDTKAESGVTYNYSSLSSAPTYNKIAMFVVKPVTFVSTTTSWTSNNNFRANATWSDAFCPAGEKKSFLTIADTATGSVMPQAATPIWTTLYEDDVATWTSGGNTRFTHIVGCLLSDTRIITSAPVVQNVASALRPPVAPTNLASDNKQGITLVVPNNVLWNTVVCAAGSPQYNLQQYAPDGTISSGWVSSPNMLQEHIAGTTYKWRVQAKCVLGAVESIASEWSDELSYTAQYARAAAPLSAPVPSQTAGVIINSNLGWSFNSDTCPAQTTSRTYTLYRNGTFVSSVNNLNKMLLNTGPTAGTYSFTYTMICQIGTYTTIESLPSPAVSVVIINKPAAPTNLSVTRVYLLNTSFSFTGVAGTDHYDVLYNGVTTRVTGGAGTKSSNALGTTRNNGFVNGNKNSQPGLEAAPNLQVRSVDVNNNVSAWVSVSVDTPRSRHFPNTQVDLFPRPSGSTETRSGNSLVSSDGEYFLILQADRNVVRYTKNGVAQAASGWQMGVQNIDYVTFDRNGAWAWYERTGANFTLRFAPNTGNDMLVLEGAGNGGVIKNWQWNGGGFTLTYTF